ncbi:DUF2461 domain-containing protein [Nocardia pseudobrasiliensis]|uniref:Uncharacterized protein (TIGR02453 family) n=1 Tax=Nocardia pseudobrasiliensis TaxID=45979 RepID=A0A370I7S1_9NOCA|nr:DUF2461 domain-containing protein [Nocardia pseudobrasiliensis]RDI66786.1 uncharacterized protein (TIGR02453 family) [Nocardia pseudobrasiliensis]
MSFAGFPLAGLDFYEDLEADNSKSFWTAHKHIYDKAVREPMTALCAELEADFGPAKIFRPYRDVRFASDKRPYKDHQGAVVHSASGAGWYVQIGAPGLFVAGGLYAASPEQLARLRTTIDDEVRGHELEQILAGLTAVGYQVGGDRLKTKPKGFSADHPRIDLLRHKSIVVSKDFGAPDWLETPRAAKEIRQSWETLRPAVEWLSAVVGT